MRNDKFYDLKIHDSNLYGNDINSRKVSSSKTANSIERNCWNKTSSKKVDTLSAKIIVCQSWCMYVYKFHCKTSLDNTLDWLHISGPTRKSLKMTDKIICPYSHFYN